MFMKRGLSWPMILRAPETESGAAPAAAATAAPVVDSPAGDLNVREAAIMLRKQRDIPKDDAPDKAAPSVTDSADEADAAPAETPISDEAPDSENDPADAPTIDPPRSWSKEDQELFRSLPAESQQRLIEIDEAREKEIRRGQNEIAEQRKAFEAERAATEQARQQYEAALPQLAQVIQAQLVGEFSDIKTWDDAERMRLEDPLRYVQWDAANRRAQAVQAEMARVVQAREAETAKAFETFRVEETRKFLEKAPEFKDAAKATAMQAEAKALFEDIGLTDQEFDALANGKSGISIHDHRVQLILRDALRFRAAQRAAKQASPKPAAPVTRPGTAQNKGERAAADVQAAFNKLQRTHSAKDAAQVLRAMRRAS